MRISLLLKSALVVVATTTFYGYLGQLVPQEEILPPDPVPGEVTTGASRPVSPESGRVFDLEAVERGRALYHRTCFLCHGDSAQGDLRFNAPKLAGQDAWYLERQLENFVAGRRGSDPTDIYGSQMRPMAMTLTGEQDISDISEYLASLGGSS